MKNFITKNALFLIAILVIAIGGYYQYGKIQKMKSEVQRLETNYSAMEMQNQEAVNLYHSQILQLQLTQDEFETAKNAEIQALKIKLKNTGIKVGQLEQALIISQNVTDTLYITKIDTVLKNCLDKEVPINFKDEFTNIDILLKPDLTASASYSTQAKLFGAIYRDKVPKNTSTFTEFAFKYKLTKWMVRKKVVYKTDIQSDNPHLQLANIQSLRIIDN